jgi:hypothetical protein
MNDTKWDELRLTMYDLGRVSPRFRVKHIDDTEPGPWDAEWYYHFRQGGYACIEWVELRLAHESHRAEVARVLGSIHVPGVGTSSGFIVYGYVAPGTPVEYL